MPLTPANAIREPWFGTHHTRDLYCSLLSMEPTPARPVLIAALIRRAMTDVQRIMDIRENKAALQNLLTKGQIGDDTWNHILEAEKELDSEIYEVVQEANTFRPGWGQIIFAHAGDMIQHEKNRKFFEEIEEQKRKLGGWSCFPSRAAQARAWSASLTGASVRPCPRVPTAAKYNGPAPLITPPPILGISAANPKKRVLPASVPTNANVLGAGPNSKPGTPQPQRVMAGPNGQPMLPGQPGQPGPGGNMSPAQMQAAAQLQNAIRQHQAQLAAQAAQQQQQGGASAAQSPAKAGAAATSGPGTPPKPATNGSAPASGPGSSNGPATLAQLGMQRQASTMSSVGGESGDESEDDGASVGGASSQGGVRSATASPRKTPNKKGKKKKGGKKK